MEIDMVNHPPHYAPKFKSKLVECADIADNLMFSLGNAFKYVWRAGDKGGKKQAMQDIDKACWYLKKASVKLNQQNADEARRIFNSLEDDGSARYRILKDLLDPEQLFKQIHFRNCVAESIIKRPAFIEEVLKQVKGRTESGETTDWELLNKMEQVLKLYPGNEWQSAVKMQCDEEHDLRPVSSVSLGRWADGKAGHWSFLTLVLDEKGTVLSNDGPLPGDWFECTSWSFETPTEHLIDKLCDEILKRAAAGGNK